MIHAYELKVSDMIEYWATGRDFVRIKSIKQINHNPPFTSPPFSPDTIVIEAERMNIGHYDYIQKVEDLFPIMITLNPNDEIWTYTREL